MKGNWQIKITVCDPQKIGEGMSAYVVYKIMTKTNLPCFRKKEFSVSRRFSDFRCLHGKLTTRRLPQGIIVPPAPGKSLKGMAKVKASQNKAVLSDDFITRRRAALERYLNRIASHPVLRMDPDFVHFLETEYDVFKETIISALGDTVVVHLFNEASAKLDKVFDRFNEPEQWFEDKQREIEDLQQKLRKLQSSTEAVMDHRKDLLQSVEAFSGSVIVMNISAKHTALLRGFEQLANIESKVEKMQCLEANQDTCTLFELLNDYINIIDVIKDVFNERVKIYKVCNRFEKYFSELMKEIENNEDPSLTDYFEESLEKRKEEREVLQDVFKKISETIRKEVEMFEQNMGEEFKRTIETHLEHSLEDQQKIINYWKSLEIESVSNA